MKIFRFRALTFLNNFGIILLRERKEICMDHIKMDYDLATAEERVQKVEEIIANTPPEKLSPSYLDELGNYIVTPIKKENYNRE